MNKVYSLYSGVPRGELRAVWEFLSFKLTRNNLDFSDLPVRCTDRKWDELYITLQITNREMRLLKVASRLDALNGIWLRDSMVRQSKPSLAHIIAECGSDEPAPCDEKALMANIFGALLTNAVYPEDLPCDPSDQAWVNTAATLGISPTECRILQRYVLELHRAIVEIEPSDRSRQSEAASRLSESTELRILADQQVDICMRSWMRFCCSSDTIDRALRAGRGQTIEIAHATQPAMEFLQHIPPPCIGPPAPAARIERVEEDAPNLRRSGAAEWDKVWWTWWPW